MGFPYGFSVTVERSTGTDRYGNSTGTTTFTIDGVAGAPVGTIESVNGQDTVVDQDSLYVDYDDDVRPGDTVVVPLGTSLPPGTYTVDGSPARWRSPFSGREAGTVVRLQRVEG